MRTTSSQTPPTPGSSLYSLLQSGLTVFYPMVQLFCQQNSLSYDAVRYHWGPGPAKDGSIGWWLDVFEEDGDEIVFAPVRPNPNQTLLSAIEALSEVTDLTSAVAENITTYRHKCIYARIV